MPQVPHPTRTRSSHRFRTRSTHDYDAYAEGLGSGVATATQVALDEVGISPRAPVRTVAEFAQGIRPVAIVDDLPDLPDPGYPEFSYVVLTTDERLYKNVGEVWVLGIVNDIVADSITAGMIAAGAIGADEIAAGAVHADKLSVGARDGANLVLNGSFEDGPGAGVSGEEPTSWTYVLSAGGAGKHMGTGGHGGKSVRLEINSLPGTEFAYALSDPFPVTPDQKLACSGIYMADNTSGDVYFTVRFYNAADVLLTSLFVANGVIPTVADVWVEVRGYVTTPANAAYARVYVGMETPGSVPQATAWDDIRVAPYAVGLHNSDGNVLIDDNGITIDNGVLTIQDEFGATVFTSIGFEGSWRDFLRTGIMNGTFDANGTTTSPAMGRTADVPYWTLSQTNTPFWDIDPGSVTITLDSGDIAVVRSDRLQLGRESTFVLKLNERGGDLVTGTCHRRLRVYGYSGPSGGSGTLVIDDEHDLSGYVQDVFTSSDFTGFPYYEIDIQLTFVDATSNYQLTNIMLEVVPEFARDLIWKGHGTVFPTSPATNDTFYREDLDMEFFYNGTRWLSTAVYEMPIPQSDNLSATETDVVRLRAPWLRGGSDIWFEAIVHTFFVNGGGSALSGSHKWVTTVKKLAVTTGTLTVIGTFNVDSGSSAVWRESTPVDVDALMNNGTTHIMLTATHTKTGTPGNFFAYMTISYRIVAT
jgi:hypothetical protein